MDAANDLVLGLAICSSLAFKGSRHWQKQNKTGVFLQV
jgi:hypothetical protein